MKSQWKNRIVSEGDAKPTDLLANEKNWRIHPAHQQRALKAVLDEVGYVARVIVNKRTSAKWPKGDRNVETLVDGHLRVSLAMRQEEPSIPVEFVDLDPQEEKLILATLDPLAALAVTDEDKLGELLADVREGREELLADLAGGAGDDFLSRDDFLHESGEGAEYSPPPYLLLVQTDADTGESITKYLDDQYGDKVKVSNNTSLASNILAASKNRAGKKGGV